MMQTDSELESDTSSINDGMPPCFLPNQLLQHQINIAPASVILSRDQLEKRIESLSQENRVLKIEIDTFKMRVKSLQEENRELRKNSVSIQVSVSLCGCVSSKITLYNRLLNRQELNKKKNIYRINCLKRFNR